MTTEDNLKEQYRVLGLPSYEGISELLKLVGLGTTSKKKARNFSLGTKQRLGIAIALEGDSDFLVLGWDGAAGIVSCGGGIFPALRCPSESGGVPAS